MEIKFYYIFSLFLMQDSIHECESSEIPDIESSQGVTENTTETEVESAVKLTPACCNV